jgi:hypothetical protein
MPDLTRREGLGAMALLGGAALTDMALSQAEASNVPQFVTKIDFADPKWNRDTFVRIDADIDSTKEKIGWLKGTVFGVRDNEAVRPLFINEGFSFTRALKLPDGSYRRLCREVVFYRDIATGEILKTWHNPYTGESVNVVPVANDPFNYTIGEFYPDPPSYGGLNKEKLPKRPFLLNWSKGANDTIVLHSDINLYYPAALQPDKWPRESAGSFNRVSELFIYVLQRADIENPKLTNLPIVGSWSRINPWLPWMLMGQAPGGVNYFNTFATVKSIDDVPQDIVAAAKAISPKFLSAPTEDYGPSLSSLERYALEQKPASVPPGWKPPQPPAAPVLPRHG